MRSVILALLVLQLAASPLSARSKQKGPEHAASVVDAGTFSILIAGRKIGTETFSIRQSADGSVASSEIRIEEGESKARQTSELRLSLTGELRRYEWRELLPGKAQIVLEPQDEFLVERITSENEKPIEQPFLMPPSGQVLDDFFFSHREILLWRYLALVCRPASGQMQCATQKSQFGVVIPRQHTSGMVSIEYVGRDRLALNGQQLELNHFRLTAEDADDWDLWLDSNQKLVRILIPSSHTEVLRDPEPAGAKPAGEPQ
jgi:hypothetical protein